jgi:hypothetical protein
MMIARFTSRKPLSIKPLSPVSDTVPWGEAYVPGGPSPHMSRIPEGAYTLRGKASGSARLTIVDTPDHRAVKSVSVIYENYSDDGENVIVGSESVAQNSTKPTATTLDWHSNLRQSGKTTGTKITSPDGFLLTIDYFTNIFEATGTLATTINGRTYRQPGNGD